MVNTKSIISTIFGFTLVLGAANAQNPACPYDLASLQGTYAVTLTYGANIAAGLQVEKLDGYGSVKRSGPINQPTVGSPTGERTVAVVTSVGTYTVNCDGTGQMTRVVTQTNGVTSTSVDDFMITAAMKKDGRLIATAIADMQRTPSNVVPGGIFVTRVHSRLPDVP